MTSAESTVRAAEVVLPCADLAATLTFFTERLGFRLETISPAEDPSVAVISGHGTRLRLQRDARTSAGTLRLACEDPAALAGGDTTLEAPNGTRIVIAPADPAITVPPLQPALVISRIADAAWIEGRAGMLYRDLVPGRQGGRFVASHIRIPTGGPVADYVHYHRVRFQLIFCVRGSVRLVYEDQGPPFVLAEGDCVLQPPEIRHRVLECSDGLEVVEVGCPALHDTCVDHDLELPTSSTRPDRAFGGQRFARHQQRTASWGPWSHAGFECRDTGIGAATDGCVGVRIARASGVAPAASAVHELELLFLFVVRGALELELPGAAGERGEPQRLVAGDAVVVPAGSPYGLRAGSDDLELLEVASPQA